MTISFPKFYSDAKFGHIYDVTIAVTWKGKKKNNKKKTINRKFINLRPYRSFVTFHAFYFCLCPTTLGFKRYGRKRPSKRPPCFGRFNE